MRKMITDRCKVWEINDKEGYAEVKFSCSRKVKEGGYDQILIDKGIAKNGYVSDYHSFVRFVGHAYNKLKEINIGDVITNLETQDSSTEPYWDSKNNCVAYAKNERMTVFNFEIYNSDAQAQNSTRNLDKAPQVEDSPAPAVSAPAPTVAVTPEVSVEPAATAEDVCPF